MTLTSLQQRVLRRVRADKSAPAAADVNSLHIDSIKEWFEEIRSKVVEILKDSRIDIQALIIPDQSITFSSGNVTISSLADFEIPLVLKTGASKRFTPLLDEETFARYDGSSFLTTVPDEHPIAMAANGKIYMKPTDVTQGYLDYAKKHPDLSASQDTIWSDRADRITVELIAAKFFDFKGKADRAEFARRSAEVMQ
jgi:hypothetical protein